MLILNGAQLPLKNLRISVRQQLAGQDMSGQTSATDQAETGSKGKILTVKGVIPFTKKQLLTNLFSMAEAQDNDARQIYRISNQTAEALKIRQVKFQGVVRADEQESHRQWSVSFELVEHLSVPERVEQRQPDKPFIRCVLPLGFKLPGIKEGESRYQQRKGVYQLVDQKDNFERKTDQADKLECLTQQIKVLEDRIADIGGNHTETVKGNRAIKANNITEDADTIKFNGGKSVCTGASICPFMGKPHVDVSTTVFAGKD